MTTINKITYWCSILALCAMCREVQARGSLSVADDVALLTSKKQALRNEKLYEQEVEIRAHNPAKFDHLHPVLGELLTQESSFEYWLHRWEANPARFEKWHPRFWRIIDGEALEGGPSGFPISQPGQIGNPALKPVSPESGGSPGTNSSGAVPEPASLRLLLIALGLIVLVRGTVRPS